MLQFLQKLNRGYRYIDVLTTDEDVSFAEHTCPEEDSDVYAIEIIKRESFRGGINGSVKPDLPVIDLDAFTINEAVYHAFLSNCFMPSVPVRPVVQSSISKTDQKRLLRWPGVLDVLNVEDISSATVTIQ